MEQFEINKISKLIERQSKKEIISGYLAIVAAVVPLTVWPFLNQRFFYPKMIMLYIFASVLSVVLVSMKFNIFTKSLLKQPAVICTLFFGLYSSVTMFFSIDIKKSLNGVYERRETYFIILIYVFFFMVAAAAYTYKKWHITAFGVTISIICIYAIFQLYGIELLDLTMSAKYKISQSWHYIAFSTLGNPNFLGSMLSMTFPLFLFAFIKSNNCFWSIPMSLNYFILLATKTRGSWIAAFVAFSVMISILLVKRGYLKKIVISFVILISLTVLYGLLFDGFINRLLSTFTTIGSVIAPNITGSDPLHSGSYRTGLWKGVSMLIAKKPLTGYGIETLQQAINENDDVWFFLRSVSLQLPVSDKAHNEFLNICVSSGIPAALAYLGTVIFSLIKGFKNLQSHKYMLPVTCSVLAYFIQGMFNISNNGIAFIFYILMGIIISFSYGQEKIPAIPHISFDIIDT